MKLNTLLLEEIRSEKEEKKSYCEMQQNVTMLLEQY